VCALLRLTRRFQVSCLQPRDWRSSDYKDRSIGRDLLSMLLPPPSLYSLSLSFSLLFCQLCALFLASLPPFILHPQQQPPPRQRGRPRVVETAAKTTTTTTTLFNWPVKKSKKLRQRGRGGNHEITVLSFSPSFHLSPLVGLGEETGR